MMAVPILLDEGGVKILRKDDINKIQSTEMKFFRRVKRCTKLDKN